jgi:sporulation protein YlmC with PRC-barrel domain
MKTTLFIRTAAAVALLAAFGTAGARDPHDWRDNTQNRPYNASSAGTAGAPHHASLHGRYSAEKLIGMDVQARSGESIGEVQDLVLDSDGRVAGIIISAGGILGLGETTYRVPWAHVDIAGAGDHVSVPLASQAMPLFRWGAEDVNLHPGEVLAGDVIGGRLSLRDGMHAGIVGDLVIGRDGRLDTLVVASDLNGGGFADYAYPFTGELKFNPAADVYTADIGFDEARHLPQFQTRDALDVDTSIGASSSMSGSGEVGSNY